MLVLLPPSQSKATGGRPAPLDLPSLSFPGLTPVRRRLVAALVTATQDRPALTRALGLGATQHGELDSCADLLTGPTMAALRRYTGVLYDAVDYPTLEPAARRRADRSLVVASALFGLVRPRDFIPAYRLSGDTTLPGVGRLGPVWRPALVAELTAVRGLVVDLRSGAYAALAPLPGAVQVRVLRENRDTDGNLVRSVVSHDNKHTKGLLARALCESGARTPADVAEVARPLAHAIKTDGTHLDLVLRAW